MGEHEGWAQPAIGLLPNGLLPNEAASVVRALDMERWMKAEERTAELIGRIQPNPPSEELRNAVADYVQRLIMKCFPCQVFTFGSVPLKTYLPDGDIDLTAFSNNQSLKDTWAHQVRDMLESEEKNESAEFQVKEVQYIQAEVKIIKCLVENIVVDISFNQISGLCTLCFLEEVDHLIDQNHLFKRSIILIKAWCYYESRILGAHHGLISTYALETLVLYIFHVFNNSFTGPLEVLYRFLEFFSKFDWENLCVSLWGPVPIHSLPDVTAEPPRKDSGELLLSKLFLDACSSVYAVFPTGLDNSGPPFVSKHFNVIDPLRINNNLGRSVSKGNFFRIRSAFAFGARKLTRLLDCPKEDLFYEVNQFFMNAWERHGSGNRPDVLKINFQPLQSSNPDHLDELEYVRSTSNSRREISSHRGTLPDNLLQAHNISFAQPNHPRERSQAADISLVSNTQIGKSYGNSKNRKIYGQSRQDANSNQKAYNDKTSSRPENLINEIHGRFLFARTRSSPELTDNYAEVSGRLNNGVLRDTSRDLDMIMNKSTESGRTPGSSNRPLADDNSPVRHTSLHQVIDCEDSYPSDLRLGGPGADFPSFGGTHGMHQEEQDLVNIMASSAAHVFNGQVHVPLNIASGQLPLPITSSVIASMGLASRNFGGFFPANVPFVEAPWSSTVHLSQSLASPQLAQCFAGMGLTANAEESNDRSFELFHPTGLNPAEREHDVQREQDLGSSTGLELDSGSFKTLESVSDAMHHSTPSGYNVLPAQRGMNVGTSTRAGDLLTEASHGSMKEVDSEDSQYQDYKADNLNIDERTRSSKSTFASNNTSLRSKASSENSWENQATKVSKPSREKRGRRNNSVTQAGFHLKGNSLSEHSSEIDHETRELNLQSIIGSEMSKRTSGCQMVSSLHVQSHPTPGFGEGEANGSLTDSHIPITPILLGPGSQQKALDGSGAASFAFYPTGPPVPFVTMLPLYNFPTEMRALDTMSSHHFDRDDGLDRNVPGPNIDGSQGLEQSDMLNTSTSTRLASIEQFERKADILNGDFASHWKNLQIGRYCQNSQHLAPSVFPSPVMVPPLYVQGRFPFDSSGKPVLPNTSPFTQFMSSGPHPVPVAPAQSVSNRPPASLFQRCVDELPRYRVGTGTYLPNPKVSSRERYPANARRGNYSYDRSDHHGDREGSWNINSKSRATVRNNNRINTEKSGSSLDRWAGGENRAERPRSSYRHDSLSSNHIQNGPVRANPGQSGPSNVAYTIYPLPPTGPNGVSSNRPTIPSVVMLYPYENSTIYHSPAEQLEFGSLGPVGFTSSNEASQQTEETRSGGVYDELRHHGVSSQQASLDKPSSPHLRR